MLLLLLPDGVLPSSPPLLSRCSVGGDGFIRSADVAAPAPAPAVVTAAVTAVAVAVAAATAGDATPPPAPASAFEPAMLPPLPATFGIIMLALLPNLAYIFLGTLLAVIDVTDALMTSHDSGGEGKRGNGE